MRKGGNGNYRHYQHQPINLREQPRAAAKRGWLCHSARRIRFLYYISCVLAADKTNSAKVCVMRENTLIPLHTPVAGEGVQKLLQFLI